MTMLRAVDGFTFTQPGSLLAASVVQARGWPIPRWGAG